MRAPLRHQFSPLLVVGGCTGLQLGANAVELCLEGSVQLLGGCDG